MNNISFEAGIDHREIMRRAAALIAVMSVDDAMWTADVCANYLSMSQRHFAEKVSTHPDFPEATVYPIDGEKKPTRKWEASVIKAWARSRAR